MKRYWETIAERLSNDGFSWGCSSEMDLTGRVLFTADAYSRDGRRFTVLADERLSAFLELESAIHSAIKQDQVWFRNAGSHDLPVTINQAERHGGSALLNEGFDYPSFDVRQANRMLLNCSNSHGCS